MRALAVLVLLVGAEPGTPWARISDRDGLKLEVQDVPGSGFENVRITCTTRAPPRVFMKALWGVATDRSASPEVIRREVLLDEERARTYYDVVHAPPASDRDYVMHEEWTEDDRQVVTMNFATVNDPGKPVTSALVRFGKITGRLTAAPRAEGGSDLTYVIFTDLGGDIPAWLTRGAQREAARKFVLEIRRRAEEEPKK
jgi:hypothetical protein